MEISAEQMKNVNELLRGLPGNKIGAAFSNAANRALMSARGVAWESVHENYTVKKTAFYRETQVHTFRANAQSLSAAISFNGHLVPLIDFGVKTYRSHEKSRIRRLKAEVLTGEPKDLRHAYIADLGRYGESVFERMTPKRNSSEAMYGPAAAHMVYNQEVLEKMDKVAQATFNKRLDHEIERITKGYGGHK